MEKIYGFNDEQIALLKQFIKSKKFKNKRQMFKEFAVKYGRKEGSVRNMYYALAKVDNCKERVKVKAIVPFEEGNAEWLVKEILIAKSKGVSVRSAILKLVNGDMKLYLRYQNKYRNLLKKDKSFINKIALKLKLSGEIKEEFWATTLAKEKVKSSVLLKLQQEVNKLFARVNDDVLKENKLLRTKLINLEVENRRLCTILEGANLSYPLAKNPEDIIS